MNNKKLIVFDMDGVIVDVSGSYREAVRQTARLFLKGIGSENTLPDPLFSLADLAGVKQAGGLNNDWELTYHVLTLLMTQIKTPPESPHLDGWTCHEGLVSRCDATVLSAYLESSTTPLADLDKQHLGQANTWIERLSAGDVGTGNIIKQIFQELYLGGELFRRTYGFAPRIHDHQGLIDREALLIPAATIKRLAETHKLALATGRPRSEAEHALKRFDLHAHFKMTYTLDECLAEEKKVYEKSGDVLHLSKPHPFMLDAIVEQSSEKIGDLFYVGDMPDDMLAAKNSTHDYSGVGILHSSPDKQNLKKSLIKAGAEVIIEGADELLAYFS
jgi:HAD superfamily hydrolase (TIGR01548 family)